MAGPQASCRGIGSDRARGVTGAAARPATGDLITLLSDKEWLVRKTVVHALSGIAPDDPRVVKALQDTSLNDPEIQVRLAAQLFIRTLNDQ